MIEKDNLNKEVNCLKETINSLEKTNEELLVKLKQSKESEMSLSNLEKELVRTKKDRDTLLDISRRAQTIISDHNKIDDQIIIYKEEAIQCKSLLNKSEDEKKIGRAHV